MNQALLGLRVRVLGMSGRGFARSVGLSHTTVQDAEAGRIPLGRRAICKIADCYGWEMDHAGITAEDLLRGGQSTAA